MVSDIMKYILNQRQMQEIDRFSIEDMGISGLFLMEQAATAVMNEIVKRTEPGSRILVVTEGGNNGGDGMALARLLHDREIDATVYHIGAVKHTSEAFEEQKKLALDAGVTILDAIPADENYDVVVDAIFGVGLRRNVKGEQARVIDWMNRLDAYRVAVDVPSGVNPTSGEIMGRAFRADLTVTFGYYKTGLVLYPGGEYAGRVVVRDIGFSEDAILHAKPTQITFGRGKKALKDALSYWPVRTRRSHKGTYGSCLIVAGSFGMAGAAVIAARAAYRTGCGLVRVLTHEANRQILQAEVPEAVIYTYRNTEEAYKRLDDCWEVSDSVLIGPGLGQSETALGLTRAVVTYMSATHPAIPLVVDADALNIMSKHPEIIGSYKLLDPKQRCMLTITPHLKEMSRLLHCSVGEVGTNLFGSARNYLRENDLRGQVNVVLKDARTVVTDGRQPAYINMSGNNGMATAGSGDCLAGIMVSLMAQQKKRGVLPKTEASGSLLPSITKPYTMMAVLAVFIHGCAGDAAAEKYGTVSMTSSDIVECLPEVLKKYDKLNRTFKEDPVK